MPFDMNSDTTPQPQRPHIDRNAVAAAIQDQIGRVLTWDEYQSIWNRVTAWMDPAGTRNDYLLGSDPVDAPD